MNERVNELIKSIPDLKYDASTGLFETDRRALYDLIELTVQECIRYFNEDYNRNFSTLWREDLSIGVKQHFGVKE